MPTTYFVNSLGSFSFNTNGALGNPCLAKMTRRANYRERVADRPNMGGKYSAGPLFDSLTIDVEGMLVGVTQTSADFQAAMDALAGMWPIGGSAQFKLNDDRYCNAEIKSFAEAEAWKGLPHTPWVATLAAYDDPPWFDVASTTVSGLATNGSANNFTVAGTGPARPILTLIFSAAPANSTVTITDQQGNVFVISPDAAATFVIDSLAEEVSSSSVDKSALCTGQFPVCPIGANNITILLAGGATTSSASLSYQVRRY